LFVVQFCMLGSSGEKHHINHTPLLTAHSYDASAWRRLSVEEVHAVLLEPICMYTEKTDALSYTFFHATVITKQVFEPRISRSQAVYSFSFSGWSAACTLYLSPNRLTLACILHWTIPNSQQTVLGAVVLVEWHSHCGDSIDGHSMNLSLSTFHHQHFWHV